MTRLALPVENRKAPPPEIRALRTELNQFCTGQNAGQSFFTLGEFTYDLNQLGTDIACKEEASVEEARLKDYLLATLCRQVCRDFRVQGSRAFSYLPSAAEILQRSPLAAVDGSTRRKISDNIGLALGSESR